ncbi:hypothetical protein [Parapedobacter sp. 2B3]|uniref:hypothetical protein n=1 Tax=Parapedobacter sp. 2B3 TaxID=3342381 RepID=UPI0035B59F19
MQSTVVSFIALFGVPAFVQQQQHETTAAESPWRAYGYIALAAIVLIIVVAVLIKKQHRKFNE